MAQHDVEEIGGLELEAEFEQEPVPESHRKPLRAISAVWFGFPMILTCSVFGGLLAAFLGFKTAVAAILVGNLVLLAYVGALSYVAGHTGLNFGLQARRVFGRVGSMVVAGFLATVVVGWFAFQTGLTGATINQSFGWSEKLMTLMAGILFIAITFIGIRALSILGLIAVPFFLVVAVVSLIIAGKQGGAQSVLNYGGVGGGAFSFGAGVTLVVATFADSGTMTADFTRWSKSGREAVLATLTAFPIANTVAFLVGATIVSTGAIVSPQTNGGNFLPILTQDRGALLSVIAFFFIVVNLGSVCTHCLYNGAVGWAHVTKNKMRVMTVVLGLVGTVAALAGVWSHFLDWLNLLGVFVPPIGAVMIVDQLVLRRTTSDHTTRQAIRPAAAIGYIAGAVAAGLIHYNAPQFSEAIVGMVVGGLAYGIAHRLIERQSADIKRTIVSTQ